MKYNLILQKALDSWRDSTWRWEGKRRPFARPKDVQIKWVEEIGQWYVTFRLYNCEYGHHVKPEEIA